jgi:hypothetical protein
MSSFVSSRQTHLFCFACHALNPFSVNIAQESRPSFHYLLWGVTKIQGIYYAKGCVFLISLGIKVCKFHDSLSAYTSYPEKSLKPLEQEWKNCLFCLAAIIQLEAIQGLFQIIHNT